MIFQNINDLQPNHHIRCWHHINVKTMVAAASPLLTALYLLAASTSPRNMGRQRYAPKRRQKSSNKRRKSGGAHQQQEQRTSQDAPLPPPPPPPTDPNGPFPTYYTCRHSYEDVLMEELLVEDASLRVTSPHPGLVRVDDDDDNTHDNDVRDPTYALQVLPNCRIVEISNSIKGLAKSIAEIKSFHTLLQQYPTKGSLAVHALVPGMCKGQREPKMQRRAILVADAIVDLWKKRFPAARKSSQQQSQDDLLLLQVMLLSPDVAAASLSPCHPQQDFDTMLWPNPRLPLGLAQVDIETKMPSSAYRKLLEAFACWNCMPRRGDTVVDLGASPGGWTFAVLLHCQPECITAVDRAELDPVLMKNDIVEFVQGDAFAYRPPYPVDWMISDIIAYPERIVELLKTWCSNQWANNMVVTVKFQGDTPSWDALQEAIALARSHGYRARAKHFFNNKNEVTLMLKHEDVSIQSDAIDGVDGMIRGPIYERVWPKE